MQLNNSYLLGVILVPALTAIFKKEMGAFLTAWDVYRSRSFDADRDPNTPDRCQLQVGATGEWKDILIERYSMSLNKNKRGVYIRHLLDNGQTAQEKIPLLTWAEMRKRKMPE